ncbi:MAG TPA: flavodoxin [Clostridiales bacterium]|nr:flavodoxin [Clostridiales bacterium]
MKPITSDVFHIGINDRKIDLFEGQYSVPHGMAYNSYVIVDEKVAVLDTADGAFRDEWLTEVDAALNGRHPDYLIVQHMEPDHSANIGAFLLRYPEVTVVGNAKTFAMLEAFFGKGAGEHRLVVKDGDTLPLGRHTLTFVFAPMVHWPEVMVTYDSADKILFSADGFGKFGTLDADEPWEHEARRYYIGIVGKYGAQVQSLLKKAAALDIAMICPLHGPVLTEDLGKYLNLYDLWSSYRPEEEGVTIAYASVYGHTRVAAEYLAEKLAEEGEKNVALFDLSRADMAEAVASAFRYPKLVLASVTYNADVFPPMHAYLHALVERGFRARTVGLIENGSWAPTAAKVMRAALEGCKDLTFCETVVTVRSSLTDENRATLDALAKESINNSEFKMKN